MSDLILYKEDVERLTKVLRYFVKDANILCAMLTTRDGQLLTSHGKVEVIDTTSVAALVTGSFGATVAIANLIGESEFKNMFHRGKERHIFITLVDRTRYLASIFDNDTNLEMVSYYANWYANQLRECLDWIEEHAHPEAPILFDDGSDALSQIDALSEGESSAEGESLVLKNITSSEMLPDEDAGSTVSTSEGVDAPSKTAFMLNRIQDAKIYRKRRLRKNKISRLFGRD